MKNITVILRVLYPIWMLIGMFGLMYIPSVFFVEGDPLKTVENIRTNEVLFRVGFLANIVTQLLVVVIPVLLYQLLKHIDSTQAMFMLIFSLIAAPIALNGEIHSMQALANIDNPEIMMAHLNFKWSSLHIATIFWGLWLFPLGKLAIKSAYFPVWIGYCLYAAAIGYLISALVKIVFPKMDVLFTVAEILTIGEVIFILWFVIKGIKQPK
ncbi:DUF4386 domain-containing protein [Aquimarina litoralis]|uniref:DUF4386 domain-containing protein n=1 Tax=Aquimarina litoralis TaxID=584605 RepID=UPI001C56E1B3|nr:DUF4386 domain-containing protein [Aquimarina litoralis]MBW1298984.1 DUF4386 family protein [Aquimarina litoralis]